MQTAAGNERKTIEQELAAIEQCVKNFDASLQSILSLGTQKPSNFTDTIGERKVSASGRIIGLLKYFGDRIK